MDSTITQDGVRISAELAYLSSLPPLSASPFAGDGLALKAVIELLHATQTDNQRPWQGMELALEEALRRQDSMPLSSSLYRGVTGIGWAIQLCPTLVKRSVSNQFLVELDELLMEGLQETVNPNLDLINGIAGIMVYAMRRGKSTCSSENLWAAIECVCERAVRAWLGLGKRDELETIGTDFQKNLGIAHGIPGLLTMMTTALSKGYLSKDAVGLVVDGFEQLWTHSIKVEGRGALFPSFVGSTRFARLAWCYGGLGLADAYSNASSLDPANLRRFAELVEGAIFQFRSGGHLITDASLCHGWAGAHFYFHIFANNLQLEADLRADCRSASIDAGRALEALNVGTEDKPSYLRHYKGKKLASTSLLSGTSGVILAQGAVMNSNGTSYWTELLGGHNFY